MHGMIEPMRSMEEAAQITGYCAAVLRRKCRSGKGPRHFVIDGRFKFRDSDLEIWLRAHAREANIESRPQGCAENRQSTRRTTEDKSLVSDCDASDMDAA